MAKKPDSGIQGILVIDKPADFTSFDVVAKMRGIACTRKIGHGGTLDPMATGVLPLFLGRAVKAVDLQPAQDKTYEAEILFGLQTDTGDITGQVLKKEEAEISGEMLEGAAQKFLGPQSQLPPLYSAVKVDGKPLYSYAREGKEVQRTPRPVTVHSIRVLGGEKDRWRVRVHCSKGTYIRTLAEDIGAALGLPATLSALRRTAAGAFNIDDAHTLEEIQAARDENRLETLLLPLETVFQELPALELSPEALARLENGAKVYGVNAAPGVYRGVAQQSFIGLVEADGQGMLKGKKLFLHPTEKRD